MQWVFRCWDLVLACCIVCNVQRATCNVKAASAIGKWEKRGWWFTISLRCTTLTLTLHFIIIIIIITGRRLQAALCTIMAGKEHHDARCEHASSHSHPTPNSNSQTTSKSKLKLKGCSIHNPSSTRKCKCTQHRHSALGILQIH
jgi:hypothetical protein